MTKVFENFWIKLAALLLAILLWFHVVTDKTFQYEITLGLKQVELSADIVLLEPPPDDIRVVVSAAGKRLLRSDWKKSGLRLVTNQSRPGKTRVELNTDNISLINSDKITLTDIITPRDIVINADRLMEKIVPVKSRIDITPDNGFMLAGVDSILPPSVTIAGPRSLVLPTQYIETEAESHTGIRNDMTLSIALTYPDIYGLTIMPDTVSYVVAVTPMKTRQFDSLAVRLINAPPDLNYTLEPTAISIRAGGLARNIDTVRAGSIYVTADYSLADSSGTVRPTVILPPALKLVGTTPPAVRIIENR